MFKTYHFSPEMLIFCFLCLFIVHLLASASRLPSADLRDQLVAETPVIHVPETRRSNLYDNDIVWDEGDSVFRDPLASSGRLGQDDYWPNSGQGIPYIITHSGAQDKQTIEDALRIIEQRTGSCITFKQRSQEKEYIKFQPGRGCSSHIGRLTGRETRITLATECLTPGVIQHEILHALGFFHEQNRPDRDEHISIKLEYIRAGIHPINYQKLPEMATYGLPYDFNSIMHYGPFDMSDSYQRQQVIISKGEQVKMGQRQGLSILDVAEVQMAYNCSLDHLTADRSTKERLVHKPAVSRNELEPLPPFSSDPMTPEQCALQFSANCRPRDYTTDNCAITQSLQISCDKQATPSQIQDIALDLSEGPVRAVIVQTHDGEQLSFDNFAVIRKQIVRLHVLSCLTIRTTAELPQLQFSSLLSFVLMSCYGMHIKRRDFAHSVQLKEIILWNSTIQNLEKETFTDLPALKLLALEYGFHNKVAFGSHVRDYLIRLHCGCEFAWFRRWWAANRQLLRRVAVGEVYRFNGSWTNSHWSSDEIYLRIDCLEAPFPNGAASIDFTQEDFSINDDIDTGNGVARCMNTYSDTMEPLPIFSEDTMTSEQCALQFTTNCVPNGRTRSDCPFRTTGLDLNCNRRASSEEVKTMATALAATPPRATVIDLYDGVIISFANFAPICAQVVIFKLWDCRDDRGTDKPHKLRTVNLLKFVLYNCYGLIILKRDFQRMTKLRIIELSNSTIRTLEVGTFADLPSLRALALENGLKNFAVFSAEIRDYIFRLHCSCQFAWYRRWWDNNRALLRQAEFGEVFVVGDAWTNVAYDKEDIYLPVDCSAFPTGSSSIDFDQIAFSLNEKKCPS